MKQNTFKIQDLCMIGLFSAILAITAQISIPMPFGVPMTMQSFAVTLAGIVLGSRNGALSTLIYMLVGLIGLPVFANFVGGWQVLAGPTGGFILSFPIMAYLIGLGTELRPKWKFSHWTGIILGTTFNLLCGTIMFCAITQSPFMVGLTTCTLPFIPASIIKAILASMLGLNIRRRLQAFL